MFNHMKTANKSRPQSDRQGVGGEVSSSSPLEERGWGEGRSFIKIGIAGPVGSGKTA